MEKQDNYVSLPEGTILMVDYIMLKWMEFDHRDV